MSRGEGDQARRPAIGVMCDIALDPYTTHGHDGVLVDGVIANDASVAILVRQALVQAEAAATSSRLRT